MSQTVVSATLGRTAGSRPSRRLRAEGQLPGVIYGLGGESIPVAVSYVELREALKTEAGLNTVFQLDVEGKKETVLVKTIERDPIKRTVIHADFIRIDTNQKIRVKVPVHLIGEATLVAADGGLVEQKMFELEVLASPLNIPNALDADQSKMTMSQPLTIGDIEFPDEVEATLDDDVSVATGVMLRVVEEEPTEELEGEEGAEGEGEEGAEGEGESEESADS